MRNSGCFIGRHSLSLDHKGMDKSRYAWVDTAKALGIFLVFYGHLVDIVARSGVAQAFYQVKFIYAFHVPLFFFMAGFFWRPYTKMSDQFKKLVLRRLIPVFAFALFLLPLWPFHYWNLYGDVHWDYILRDMKGYFYGLPSFDCPIWFLVCLFTCEFFASLILPNLRSKPLVLLFGVSVLFIGSVMYQHTPALVQMCGVKENTWYLYESIVPLGFYAMGYALFPRISPLPQLHPRILYPVCLLALGVLLLTYKMNVSGGVWGMYFYVGICCASTGKILPFVTSAVAGIIFLLSLSAIVPRSAILLFIGRHTLALLGINGLFYHFVNFRLVQLWMPENTFFSITIYCTVVTLLSLAVSSSLAALLDRFVPQLMGKSNIEGPLLPNLESINWTALAKNCKGRILHPGSP